ncbi:hypothetical protein ES703_00002 [subsurface metagenome]
MPVTERRKVTHTPTGEILHLPKGWTDMFGTPDEVDLVIDTPVVVFAPPVKSNKQRIDALKKIIQILEAVPEIPYPLARGKRKVKK